MRFFPEDTKRWLPPFLRNTIVAFLVVNFLPYLFKMIMPFLVAGQTGYFDEWRFEQVLFEQLIGPFLIIYAVLFVAILVLSSRCLVIDRKLARAGFFILGGTVLLNFIFLPALARAREKPVIYLYPESEETVNVKLHYEGTLVSSYPEYPEVGWTVIAKPSGELTNVATGRRHYCLFWEGEDDYLYDRNQGFVVKGSDTAEFLEENLSMLGLSEREANEFIIYWLPRMEKNRFNLIHFATDEYDKRIPLEISPPPDTVVRVFMIFESILKPRKIEAQKFKHVERKGFIVVEWGGTELR